MRFSVVLYFLSIFFIGCEFKTLPAPSSLFKEKPEAIQKPKIFQNKNEEMAWLGLEQIGVTKSYDPSYVKLAYPMGDVPPETGVCADVVVRAFRKMGIDLQQEIHEDMKANFKAYPQKWGLTSPDKNIDHRRVPNIRTWFERQGKSLAVSTRARDFKVGDVVSWDLGNGLVHIGVVSPHLTADGIPFILHNIGAGAEINDILFSWKITGHYRYF